MNDLEMGHVVYTKSVFKFGDGFQLGYRSKTKKHFMLVLLGVLQDRKKLPTKAELRDRMSSIGYATFDDIKEAIGEAAMKKVLKFVDKKYAPKKEKNA